VRLNITVFVIKYRRRCPITQITAQTCRASLWSNTDYLDIGHKTGKMSLRDIAPAPVKALCWRCCKRNHSFTPF